MTQKNKKLDFGLPNPITKLTYEQDLRMRILEDRLNSVYHDHKKDIITLFLALQKQNFVLGNSLTNLLKKWTTIEEEALKYGISSETKTSTST